MALPLPLRNRLAGLVLDAFHDAGARDGLAALVAVCEDSRALPGASAAPAAFPAELFERSPDGLRLRPSWAPYAAELCARARRAWSMLRPRPLDPADASLEVAVAAAGALFDAGLYFEVHERLEPHWVRAEGRERLALQGIIQAAVGFEHLANGNLSGARALLREGSDKMRGSALAGRNLDGFAQAVARGIDRIPSGEDPVTPRFDWASVPRFPARA
ncbi:MAG: DUF309 domain-containing protein, partial [Candidatus Rokubacteria bacterium]|nr:DUF309 domain-containing protein [Candidatus Rokubacteria bacterium]